MQTTTPRTSTHLSIILIIAGLAAFIALPAKQARAQTPVTKIENTSGDSVFTVFDDGALLGLGELNTGVIPVSGEGVRMMWYPAKGAFRAGGVGGGQWSDANIGFHSVALNSSTIASSNHSTAIGYQTTSSGYASVAMGSNTTASHKASTAMGSETNAIGHASTAMGWHTTAATYESLTIGQYNNKNRGNDDSDPETGPLFVVGNGSSGDRSDALVLDVDAGLVVNGELATGVIPASGAGTRMMWHPAKAAFRAGEAYDTEWDDANIGDHSVAMGRFTEASGNNSTAMGQMNSASGPNSTAMGFSTEANGNYSTTMGDNTTAATEASLSIGVYNSANSIADGTLFVIGNGEPGNSSDAFIVDNNGDVTANSHGTFSDRRLKESIQPLGRDILNKLLNIKPVQYEFKNQQTHPAGKQVGLIAQEVEKQFPELVNKGSSGYLSVVYPKFTAVLLKGMQEQQQEIEKQQATIDRLKKKTRRIAALEKQVSEIKQNRQMAGLPASAVGFLLLGMVIGGGLWWRSWSERTS